VTAADRALDEALGVLTIGRDGPAPVAIGWATVEHDRAAAAFEPLLPPGATFRHADRSELLGAACRVADLVPPGWPRLVLLEPDTEGRLAATLARGGESWAAEWSLLTSADAGARPADADGTRALMSAVHPGPLGPERLRLGGAVRGPHHLLLRAGPA
jgi:hypothetical protein